MEYRYLEQNRSLGNNSVTIVIIRDYSLQNIAKYSKRNYNQLSKNAVYCY